MHFRPESYVFYDRLIENMILFEGVNSDKVYLLGYSAGGDGVYQIASRMADRFAAVNMSAGHHNEVGMTNLASLPIALQAGEYDSEYARNFETVKMSDCLDSLEASNPGYYIHSTWIHARKGHEFADNAPDEEPQAVLADLRKWQILETREYSKQNTNAVSWVRQFVRNPRPLRVVWDLKMWSDRHGDDFWKTRGHGQQFYWVDIGDNTAEMLGIETIIVELEPKTNMIKVEKFGKYLRVLVDGSMLDFNFPVRVLVHGQVHEIQIESSRDIQVETMRQRGDPKYIFEGSVTLGRQNGELRVTSP